jgi:hypothetical protein
LGKRFPLPLRLADIFHNSGSVVTLLVKRFWDGLPEEPIVSWTPFRPSPSRSTVKPGPVSPWITAVDCAGNRIAVLIDGIQAISVTDDTFDDGQNLLFYRRLSAFIGGSIFFVRHTRQLVWRELNPP